MRYQAMFGITIYIEIISVAVKILHVRYKRVSNITSSVM